MLAGTVFMFDSVIADTRQLQQQAWRQLAQEENLPFPAEPRHLYDMRAERVITEVLSALPPTDAASRDGNRTDPSAAVGRSISMTRLTQSCRQSQAPMGR